jgi:hypothetical protein
MPIECRLNYRTFKKDGWRNNRFGPSYERPEKTVVTATVTFSVLHADGSVQFQRIVHGSSKRPFMYEFFRRFARKNNAKTHAESLYGPPGLKALNEAVKSFCVVQSMER